MWIITPPLLQHMHKKQATNLWGGVAHLIAVPELLTRPLKLASLFYRSNDSLLCKLRMFAFICKYSVVVGDCNAFLAGDERSLDVRWSHGALASPELEVAEEAKPKTYVKTQLKNNHTHLQYFFFFFFCAAGSWRHDFQTWKAGQKNGQCACARYVSLYSCRGCNGVLEVGVELWTSRVSATPLI